VEPPIGLTIQKGKLAQLTCYVQGDPFPEVTWLFEDEQKGKLAQLTCYVQGDPFPEVTWLFEDEIITPSETVSLRYVLSTLLPRPHQ